MKTFLLLAGAAALASTSPALAKPGKGQGNPHAGHAGHVGYGTGGCPPGLAKKNNGCLPPGQAKKLFNVGQRCLTATTATRPTTDPLRSSPPYDLNDNYRYIYRDDYLYQVDPTTLVVQRILNAIL